MKINKNKYIWDLIDSYVREYPDGFTEKETEEIFSIANKKIKLNRKKFNDSLFGNAVMIIDNKTIIYVTDLYYALINSI